MRLSSKNLFLLIYKKINLLIVVVIYFNPWIIPFSPISFCDNFNETKDLFSLSPLHIEINPSLY